MPLDSKHWLRPCLIHNLLEVLNIKLIQVLLYKVNLRLFCYRKIALNAHRSIIANWTWGSRLTLWFDWGDGTPITPLNITDNGRSASATHQYTYPGTFLTSVKVFNYRVDCSNQTLALASPVQVDYPLPAYYLTGNPLSLMPHPNYTTSTHYAYRNFQLCIQANASVPIYPQFNFSFGDGTWKSGNFTCNASSLLSKDYNYCPANYSFCAYTPYHSFYLWGSVHTSASLWNFLNSVSVEFTHFIYSQVKDLQDMTYAIDSNTPVSIRGPNTLWQIKYTPYYPLQSSIWFVANLSYGPETNLTYYWSFGDGNYSISNSPFATHKYAAPGNYTVILNASNPLSSQKVNTIVNSDPSNTFVATGVIIIQRCVLQF